MALLTVEKYLYKAPFALEAIGITMPSLSEVHPNRSEFGGVVTRIDEPSTRAPNGSKGHRVLIPHAVAQAALPTLIGMGVNVASTMEDHNKRLKIGVITEAHIDGKDLVIHGHLFEKDFGREVADIREHKAQLGFSYEISDVQVEDEHAPVWVLTHFIFTGAAILEKTSAAYQDTAIAARAEEDFMPGVAEAIEKKLDRVTTMLRSLEAARQDEDDEAAAAQEADAKRHEEEATRHEEEAAKARKDADDEDAKRHDAEATKARMAASVARLAAAKRHEDASMRLRASSVEASDDAGKQEAEADAKRHDEEAKRLKDEDARCTSEEEARRRDEEEAGSLPARFLRTLRDESAAMGTQHTDKDQVHWDKMMSMMLRAMGDADAKKKPADADDDETMARHFATFMRAMTYMPTMSAQQAKHDDKEEDIALIKQFLRRGAEKTTMAASTPVSLEERRRLRRIEAATELLTDQVSKLTGLITDMVHKTRDLATDGNQGHDGGQAQRKTLHATTEQWADKYGEHRNGGETKRGARLTDVELDAAVAHIQDPKERMARKINYQTTGRLE